MQINNSVSSASNISFASVLMGGIFEVKYVKAEFCLSPGTLFHYFHNVELHQL